MRIGLDAMGGDTYPAPQVAGALQAREAVPEVEVVLVGQQPVIQAELERQGASADAFPILHAEEVISMQAQPRTALRQRPNSSLMVGVQAVKAEKLSAFLSAGNTGAVMAASAYLLGVMPGIARPTVGSMYPLNGRLSFVCDVGANIEVKAEALHQFAHLGSLYMQTMYGIPSPRVALLNIGEEATKGTQVVQQAFKLLEEDGNLNFVGNAEGRDFYRHTADVFVCDGFVGNILLKFGESFFELLQDKVPKDPSIQEINPENIGGLPFLGVNGHILVAHGNSGPAAFLNMIRRAKETVESNLLTALRERFAHLATAR